MKGLLAILSYFYTYIPIVKKIAIVGLLLILLTIFVSDWDGQFGLMMMGGLLTFGLSYFSVAFSSFRVLISNRRLSSIPGFHVKAGIALLFFTLLTSQFFTLGLVIGPFEEIQSLRLPLQTFIGVSIFLAAGILFQRTYGLTFWGAFVLLQVQPAIDFIIFSIGSNLSTGIMLVITVLAWVYGFYLLATQGYFGKPKFDLLHISSYQKYVDAERQQSNLKKGEQQENKKPQSKRQRFFSIMSVKHSDVLEQTNESFYRKIYKGAYIIIFNAVIMTVSIGLTTLVLGISPFWTEDTLLIENYLLMSLFSPCFYIFLYRSRIVQSRKVWLRLAGNRGGLWKLQESNLITEVQAASFSMLFNAVLAIFFSQLSLINCCLYFTLILTVYLYSAYAGFLGGCKNSSDLGLFMAVGIPLVIVLSAFSTPFLNNLTLTISTQIILALGVVLLRFRARAKFLKVDWFQINPHRQLNYSKSHRPAKPLQPQVGEP